MLIRANENLTREKRLQRPGRWCGKGSGLGLWYQLHTHWWMRTQQAEDQRGNSVERAGQVYAERWPLDSLLMSLFLGLL